MVGGRAMDEAIAGATAGVVGTTLGYPLDSIKTRMQAGASSKGIVARIFREEGVRGFYRGVASPLAALTILNTLNFSTYARFRTLIGVSEKRLADGFFEPLVPLAAAAVGPISALISTPFELVKTQMVRSRASLSSSSSSSSSSSLAKAIELVREHGVASLYRGHVVNTSREIVFLSTYFAVYEHTRVHLQASSLSPSFSIPLAGGISGAIGWFVSFPLDCIKSNIQIKAPAIDGVREGTLQVARALIKSKGFVGLYSGVVPSIARAFVVSSSRFTAYEGMLALLKDT